jgi:hypothetical protein
MPLNPNRARTAALPERARLPSIITVKVQDTHSDHHQTENNHNIQLLEIYIRSVRNGPSHERLF